MKGTYQNVVAPSEWVLEYCLWAILRNEKKCKFIYYDQLSSEMEEERNGDRMAEHTIR